MRIAVDGFDAYAYSGGRPLAPGRPGVLFVHGAANDHSVWMLQSRYFAHHGWNAMAVDLPGHGRSAGTALPSVEAIAGWLAALADAAGLARYAVVGHSMGALAALEHAARYGERVCAAALLGPAVPMAVSDALLDAAAADEPRARAMITGWSHGPAHQLGGSRQPGTWLSGQTLRLLERATPGVLHVDLSACRRYANGMQAAAAVECPVLLVLGARDQMAPPRNAAALENALRDAHVVTLPGAGHAMMSEEPDQVLDALRGFVPG
jgi:pimeloyl-ACP methyl ester carboxylesterase